MTYFILIAVLLVLPLCLAHIYWSRDEAAETDPRNHELIQKIDRLLPQTQCGACSYSGCMPYAIAIANNEADINQCPPGGSITINLIAELLGRDTKPLNTAYGTYKRPAVAIIDERACIGCTKCIPACPVDAIIGAAKQMHSIISQSCTGCELCIAPCPVDCITMIPIADNNAGKWIQNDPRISLENTA